MSNREKIASIALVLLAWGIIGALQAESKELAASSSLSALVLYLQALLPGLLGYHAGTSSGDGSKVTPAAPVAPAPGAQGGFARIGALIATALAALAILTLSGCATPITSANTPIGAFTLADAQGASALAQQNGDASGQKCYDYIASSIKAAGAVPFTPGLLYLNEIKRTATNSAAGLAAACGGVLPIVVGL